MSKKGRDYKKLVRAKCIAEKLNKKLDGRLKIVINCYPPDNRKRDIDNLLKSLLDALQSAGVYVDDSQIDCLIIKRMHTQKFGQVNVVISEIKLG